MGYYKTFYVFAAQPCINDGVCLVRGDSYTCLCSSSYTGRHCETDNKGISTSDNEIINPDEEITSQPSNHVTTTTRGKYELQLRAIYN